MVHHQCCMPSSPYKKTHPSDLQSTWKFQMFFKETDLHYYSRAQIIKLKTTVFPYIFINIRLQYCYNSLIKTLINSHLKKQQLVSPKKLKPIIWKQRSKHITTLFNNQTHFTSTHPTKDKNIQWPHTLTLRVFFFFLLQCQSKCNTFEATQIQLHYQIPKFLKYNILFQKKSLQIKLKRKKKWHFDPRNRFL
jgi:hypothetical protein